MKDKIIKDTLSNLLDLQVLCFDDPDQSKIDFIVRTITEFIITFEEEIKK